MFHDYAHAARYYGLDDASPDLTPSTETERLYALKVAIEACGFDIPDPLHDHLELSIDNDLIEIAADWPRADEDALREQFMVELRHCATLEWALRVLPGFAADEAAKALRYRVLHYIGMFARSLVAQVPA